MRKDFLLFAAVLLLANLAGAKDEPKFKSIEVKHFSQVEGVELPPEFSDFLYAELRATLQKKKVTEQILGEDEVVEPADAANSMILEGSVLEYKKGSIVKEKLIGFGVGARSLTAHLKLVRRSNNQAIIDKDLKVKLKLQLSWILTIWPGFWPAKSQENSSTRAPALLVLSQRRRAPIVKGP